MSIDELAVSSDSTLLPSLESWTSSSSNSWSTTTKVATLKTASYLTEPKGVLSFDIIHQDSKTPIATIISTHLQHSEVPANPEEDERKARAVQMNKIVNQIKTKIDKTDAVIFTGDLNQEESELNAFLDRYQINWLRRDPSVRGKPTWGGDKWCAELMGKSPSDSLTLDYTFIAGKATAISTRIVGTNFSGSEFRSEATSDHDLLFSTITLG